MLAVSWPGNGPWIPVTITVVTAIIFFLLNKKRFAIALVLAPLVGNLVKTILKQLIRRPRPGWVGCKFLVSPSDFSFPSGHTVFYTIFFGLLAWYGFRFLRDRWYGKLLYLFSCLMILLVGFSRVYLGAHWVTDVLAGYFVGGIILAGTIYLLNKYPEKAK